MICITDTTEDHPTFYLHSVYTTLYLLTILLVINFLYLYLFFIYSVFIIRLIYHTWNCIIGTHAMISWWVWNVGKRFVLLRSWCLGCFQVVLPPSHLHTRQNKQTHESTEALSKMMILCTQLWTDTWTACLVILQTQRMGGPLFLVAVLYYLQLYCSPSGYRSETSWRTTLHT